MKVLHVIKTLCAGGAELHLLSLTRQLRRSGIDVVVARLVDDTRWGSRLLNADFEQAGARLWRLSPARGWTALGVMGLLEAIRRERPDIIHTHLPRGDVLGAAVRLWGVTVPWVSSVHDIHSLAQADRWGLGVVRRAWRRADRVIAISHAVREWLVRDMAIPASRIEVIHYGIDAEEFEAAAAAQRRPLSCGHRMVIGSVGRLEGRKGHEYLVRAMPEILKHCPEARLRIAGNDPWGHGAVLASLAGTLGVRDSVELVGFRSDVAEFLASIDIFAFASLVEGFGQVVTEAMAAARPVVTSRVPPLTEIVVDGETGLLVDPRDTEGFAAAVLWLARNPEAARRMGERGRMRVHESFSTVRMARQTERLYESLLAEKGRDSAHGTRIEAPSEGAVSRHGAWSRGGIGG